MKQLMTIAVEGNELVALSPVSGIELARVTVRHESTIAHVNAAERLLANAFEALNAEGFERAKVE